MESTPLTFLLLNSLVLFLLLAVPLAALILLHVRRTLLPRRPPSSRSRGQSSHLLVVLGSGGHTTEMLLILGTILEPNSLPLASTFRHYIVSTGDIRSVRAAAAFEAEMESRAQEKGWEYAKWWAVSEVPRARKIHQSLLSAPWSCLQCLWACVKLLRTQPHKSSSTTALQEGVNSSYPDLILTNGPATSCILLLAACLLRLLRLPRTAEGMRGIYVESWARVKSLSLTGKMVLSFGLCERVIVQWAGLEGQKGWWWVTWLWKGGKNEGSRERKAELMGWLVT